MNVLSKGIQMTKFIKDICKSLAYNIFHNTLRKFCMNDSTEKLPTHLLSSVEKGEVILFLGAGASKGSKHIDKIQPPNGEQLKEILSKQFLDGELINSSLQSIAEHSISDHGLTKFNNFLKKIFEGFTPAEFHLKLPSFVWHAIITTNYDLVIERAYKNQRSTSLQNIVPFIKEGRGYELEKKEHTNPLPYLKLHGCISQHLDKEAPMIITPDQYTKYKHNREHLFSLMKNWGRDLPIVFCGYSLEDHNVREVLFDLFDKDIDRPMFYIVSPEFAGVQKRRFEQNRITPLEMTFSKFINLLDAQIPRKNRILSSFLDAKDSSLSNFFATTRKKESNNLLDYLVSDVTHIYKNMPTTGADPEKFYQGLDDGFAGIAAGLDVTRKITDTIMANPIVDEEDAKRKIVELFVIKGAAGYGKTTSLKRTAWQAANDFDKLVFYISELGVIRPEMFEEIYELTKTRIFLFIDRTSFFVTKIKQCLEYLEKRNVRITIITAERNSEWNSRCQLLEKMVSQVFDLHHLSEVDIRKLIAKLEMHNALGILADETPEVRFKAFNDKAERQILVALYEITRGEKFEDILVDEYERITPPEAKQMYLDICTLNRFNIRVRAGLVKRLSDIGFRDFEERLVLPLEKVIITANDKYLNDYVYKTRHSYVAEIVFNEVLNEPENKLNQILRILSCLELGYAVDKKAFREITSYKNIKKTFSDIEQGRAIYIEANMVAPNDNYLLHQEGLFELNHRDGDNAVSESLLKKAEANSPDNPDIQTSRASLFRELASKESNQIKRTALRTSGLNLINATPRRKQSAQGRSVKISILIDEVKDLLAGEEKDQKSLLIKMQEIEREFTIAHSEHLNNEFLHSIESHYLDTIGNFPKALLELEKSFNLNPRQEWIALRLVKQYVKNDREKDAKDVLKKVITINPTARQAHLQLGIFKANSASSEERSSAISNFRSALNDGVDNFRTQLWYGRELFSSGNFERSKDIFDKLKAKAINSSLKRKISAPIKSLNGKEERFSGTIIQIEAGFLFISSKSHDFDFYCSQINEQSKIWNGLSLNAEINFSIGFTYNGVVAFNLTIN